jgi:hypothetical protein
MPDLIPPADLDATIASVERSAFRLETRDQYGVDYETEPWLRWRRREPDDMAWHQPWLDLVRGKTAAGMTFRRVRLTGRELTEYQHFLVSVSTYNAAAGEDIRYLRREQATALGVPTDADWWLMDGCWLIRVLFDNEHRLIGARIDRDPRAAECCRAWQELLWRHALPFGRYLADRQQNL